MSSELLKEYVEKGWYLLPVDPDSKIPAVYRHKRLSYHDAHNNLNKLTKYFEKYPNHNLAVNLERSGLVCIDVDTYKPECEFDKFIAGREMPSTLIQKSANGGTHYIFKCNPNDNFPGHLCKGVEIKHRGYVLIEPSQLNGKSYEWQTDDEPAALPSWVPRKKLISTDNVTSIDFGPEGVNFSDTVALIKSGQDWHMNILRLVGSLVSKGWTAQAIHAQTDQLTLPGWTVDQTRREVQGMIDDALKKGFQPTTPQVALQAPVEAPKIPLLYPGNATPIINSSYLVKGWLDRNAMSVVYGNANVGKSFWALDLAYCVAAGVEWHGHRVKQGAVLYLATEGGSQFTNRIFALHQRYRASDVPLAVRRAPIDLLRPETDMPDLAACIREIEATGQTLELIVVDTLSRALSGGDENGPDMMSYVRNIDAIKDMTNAHVMTVHHSGKDESRGSRGHSSLRAAIDTEIHLTIVDGIHFAKATKQRDQEISPDMAFTLTKILLGEDQDGDPVTTAVVTTANEDDARDAAKKTKPSGRNQSTIYKAFQQLRQDGYGKANPSGVGWPEAGKYWCIEEEDLREFALGKLTGKNTRSAYSQAFDGLVRAGIFTMNQGHVWISTKAGMK